jgi:hypothetical protein
MSLGDARYLRYAGKTAKLVRIEDSVAVALKGTSGLGEALIDAFVLSVVAMKCDVV